MITLKEKINGYMTCNWYYLVEYKMEHIYWDIRFYSFACPPIFLRQKRNKEIEREGGNQKKQKRKKEKEGKMLLSSTI